ncbi:MAG TPA: hypothetical protein VF868_02975 [Bacteroidia bacterium]|jgi:hypothetical protein
MRLSLMLAASCCMLFISACSNRKKDGSEVKSDSTSTIYYEFHDFESLADSRVDSSKGSSGKFSGAVSDKIEYGFGLDRQIKEISSYKSLTGIRVSFNAMMDKLYPDAVFVLSIDDTVAKKNVLWESSSIKPAKLGEWSSVNLTYKIKQEFLQPEYIIKLYIWNKGKNTFSFDDLVFDFVKAK